MKKLLVLMVLSIVVNTSFAQTTLKIQKDDGSIIYVNPSEVNKMTFETPLAVGDSYQGGIIFYMDPSGEHGLITAPSDQSNSIQWQPSNIAPTNISFMETGVGGGEKNTNMIVGVVGTGSYAAKLCYDLTEGGYTDWFLPSKDELRLMHDNLFQASPVRLGDFSNATTYLSSTQGDNYITSWSQYFHTLGLPSGPYPMGTSSKNSYLSVRCVRAF